MPSKFVNWIKCLPDSKNSIIDEKQIAKQYRFWRKKMFFGMYIGYVMYYFTRKNMSYAAPSLINDLGITKIEFGIIGSSMYVSYGIGKFISGVIADECNIRSFMAFGLIGSSIINLFFGFLPSLPLLTFFWGINGAFQSMGFPPAAKGLVYWFSSNERATKWSLWSSSYIIGALLTGVLAGLCIAANHWRATFYIPGIIGLISGICLLFTLTDKPSSVGLPPIDVYRNDILPVNDKNNLSRCRIITEHVFCNPFLWSLAIAYVFIYFVRFATLDWGALFMTERGITKNRAAYLLILMQFVGAIGGTSAGWIADKFFKGRCVPVNLLYLLCLIFSLFGMYHFTNSGTPWWIVGLFLSLVGFFVDGPQNLIGGVQISRIAMQESISAACGFVGMFGYLGAFLSGIGAAWFIERWGWDSIFVTCSVCCALAMLFISIIWKKEIVNDKKLLNQKI
jgi:sugar phosphate permease